MRCSVSVSVVVSGLIVSGCWTPADRRVDCSDSNLVCRVHYQHFEQPVFFTFNASEVGPKTDIEKTLFKIAFMRRFVSDAEALESVSRNDQHGRPYRFALSSRFSRVHCSGRDGEFDTWDDVVATYYYSTQD